MIILETNVNGVLALPPKCDAPIASNRNGVLSTPVAFERVISKARKIYISGLVAASSASKTKLIFVTNCAGRRLGSPRSRIASRPCWKMKRSWMPM